MRLVVGFALIDRGFTGLWSAQPIQAIILCGLEAGAGALLLAGLWTPVAGTLVAAIETWKIFLHPGDLWICILLGTFGVALAMLGPGAWSVDARHFGWKRIRLPTRKS